MADNAGALAVDYQEVPVDALTNANSEPWSPDEETTLTAVDAVQVIGFTGGDTYTVTWDHEQEAFVFATIADGTDPGSGTDVGTITVRAEGRR